MPMARVRGSYPWVSCSSKDHTGVDGALLPSGRNFEASWVVVANRQSLPELDVADHLVVAEDDVGR